ncbi:hypothetical protein DN752_08755 [Echinicola strongylocentroti]|uniref:Uncharacterized protein n=1 Tax=Echinicola strongylocentroti TaxID=1795355 RepID=A0A2Z4II24_9BACT|nr:hypothetical protein DN752_08755 [Echinicola strongylocentroti]
MLDPATIDGYRKADIYIFELDEKEDEQVIQEEGLFIEPDAESGHSYMLHINNIGKSNMVSENTYQYYLRLSPDDVDTLKVEHMQNECSQSNKAIWYNGELVFDVVTMKEMPIIVTKE